VLDEVAGLGLDPWPPDEPLVTQADLEALPPVVQRYLRFMGVIGRPRARSLMMRFSGSFLFGGEWVPCECAQYDSRLPVARIFHMRLRVKGIVPTYVRDTYLRGRGHMVGKALGALTVVDDESEPTTIGECVTYLNDAILMAPSLLLGPEVEWTAQGEGAFDVALTDAGRTVRARVFVDEAGPRHRLLDHGSFLLATWLEGPAHALPSGAPPSTAGKSTRAASCPRARAPCGCSRAGRSPTPNSRLILARSRRTPASSQRAGEPG
jgi:hypothetical protein